MEFNQSNYVTNNVPTVSEVRATSTMSVKKDKYEFEGNVTLTWRFTAALGLCGTIHVAGPTATFTLTNASDHFKYGNDPYYGGNLYHFKGICFLYKMKLLPRVRDHALKFMANHIRQRHPYSLVTMAGRSNYTSYQYMTKLGVYTGSLGRYIAKHGLGSISCSHFHRNMNHTGVSDYSLLQTFTWSPPDSTSTVHEKLCGVFAPKDLKKSFFEAETKRLKVDKSWPNFIPSYYRRAPFKITEEDIKHYRVDKNLLTF